MLQIPGKPGYFVDEHGFAYSSWLNKGIHGLVMTDTPKQLKGITTKKGYKIISFSRKEKDYLHRIMYRTFIGEIPEGMNVLHRDGNPGNNAIINLYIGNQTQNAIDTVKHGRCKLCKLSENQVREIKSLKGTVMVKELAKRFGVDRHTITNIQKGRSWKFIGDGVSL